MANANTTVSALALLASYQDRRKMPTLAEIPDAALKKPLTFVVNTGDGYFKKLENGKCVMSGTVTYKGKTYRSAIFGAEDILDILGDVAVKDMEGARLTGTFHRTAEGGVFYRRPRKAAAVTPAEAKDTAEDVIG